MERATGVHCSAAKATGVRPGIHRMSGASTVEPCLQANQRLLLSKQEHLGPTSCTHACKSALHHDTERLRRVMGAQFRSIWTVGRRIPNIHFPRVSKGFKRSACKIYAQPEKRTSRATCPRHTSLSDLSVNCPRTTSTDTSTEAQAQAQTEASK